MSQSFQEGRIRFEFPDGWKVLRPENASYYKRHFQSFAGGCKEMDFMLFDPLNCALWLVEVKDYTTNPRTNPLCIFEEVAKKIRDSLALLLAGSVRDDPSNEGVGAFMTSCKIPSQIRVVLHLEQPKKANKLFKGIKMAADATQILRSKLRPIDCHALVTDCVELKLAWTASWKP